MRRYRLPVTHWANPCCGSTTVPQRPMVERRAQDDGRATIARRGTLREAPAQYRRIPVARMTIPEKQAIVAAIHDVHERNDLGDDEVALIYLQHELEELLSRADALLGDRLSGSS